MMSTSTLPDHLVYGVVNKVNRVSCPYCEEDIEVQTIKIDGVYYASPEINYCPFCGRKLGDRK